MYVGISSDFQLSFPDSPSCQAKHINAPRLRSTQQIKLDLLNCRYSSSVTRLHSSWTERILDGLVGHAMQGTHMKVIAMLSITRRLKRNAPHASKACTHRLSTRSIHVTEQESKTTSQKRMYPGPPQTLPISTLPKQKQIAGEMGPTPPTPKQEGRSLRVLTR
jgi:hypothetical protein